MKKIILAAVGLGLSVAAVPASAQAYQNINQRQARLDQRIDQGVRNGALTRPEARRLRQEFNGLLRLETRYRAGGLSRFERNDLNRRFDALSARVRYERQDRQDRRRR